MLKIGEFANLFNISIKTVRFYEEKELFKPFYIDKYSGYRYYDENNINEMTKILYLKELGFSLDEIKKYDEQLITDKIIEYKEKIIKLKNDINVLENFSIKPEQKSMKPFINDKEAIGKWKLIGISNTEQEAYRQEFDNTIRFEFKNLYLMENGQKYWVISWTKGTIYIRGQENSYTIKNDTMYVKILYPDDNSLYMVAVYEKENDYKYTIDEITYKDKFSGYYKEDYCAIGFWKTVDFIDSIENFNYKETKKEKDEEYIIKQITINPDDQTINIKKADNEYETATYTKGYILNLQRNNTLCKYEYKKVNGREFLIVESKSDDYCFNKKIDGYYVFEKIGGNFMEKMFESKKRMYDILSNGDTRGLVLGKEIYLPEDKRGNVNTLIVGGSGSGKSSAFSIPNILNMLGSYVITDYLGELYEKTHCYLEKNGYKVITINYEQGIHNYKYNPLSHIRNDEDIDILANILCNILMTKENDEFWNETAKTFIKCTLYYILEKEEHKDLLTLFKIIGLDRTKLFEKFDSFDSNSKANDYYTIIKALPEKTYASVVSTALMKLSFVIEAMPRDFVYDESFEFEKLSQEEIAIFIVCKENSRVDKKIANIFVSQLLSQMSIYDNKKEHIYMILDEIDEMGKLYDFAHHVEFARARKMSINAITNNLKRFETIYGDDFYTLINHIDTQCLLGTNLKIDIEYFSELLGIDKSFIKDDLDRDKLLIYEKGLAPILADKYYFFQNDEWIKILENK